MSFIIPEDIFAAAAAAAAAGAATASTTATYNMSTGIVGFQHAIPDTFDPAQKTWLLEDRQALVAQMNAALQATRLHFERALQEAIAAVQQDVDNLRGGAANDADIIHLYVSRSRPVMAVLILLRSC
jgi:hypothetical protein